MKSTRLVVLCAMLLMVAATLFAQTAETGAIAGTVTDSTGAVIPNATVTATNADTAAVRTAATGADGGYRFALLQPGPYNVKFAASGFKTIEVPRVQVTVASTPILDQKMEVGAQTEQVTVEANAETIQTASATLGTTLGGATMTSLPLTTRNYSNILALEAGVSAGVTNASALGTAGMDMAVGGAPTVSNNIQIDGANVQNYGSSTGQTTGFGNGGYNPIPSPDALQEFKVQTSNFDASYGRSIGANINVLTKSGTNEFHGTLFEFFRNTDLNANDFFLNLNGKARGVLNQNQFGGVIGGPIKKDKLFFFFSYQGTRQKNGVSPNANSAIILPPIPTGGRSNTAAFTQALGALNCPANHPGSAYAPIGKPVNGSSSTSPGVTVACDGSNINPEAISLLQAVFPNSDSGYGGQYLFPGSTTGGFQNTNFSIPAHFKEDQYMGNVDYVLNSKNTLSNRFFVSNAPAVLAFVGANLTKSPGFTAPYLYRNWVDTAKLTTVATASLVNELRGSFTRAVSNSNGNTSGLSDTALGITPASPALDASFPGFMSAIITTGTYVVGGGANGTDFSPENSNDYQLNDTLSWTHGKHTIRAGFEADQTRWHWNMAGLGAGNLNISTFADFLIGLPGCTPGVTTCTPANPGATNGTLYSNIASTSSVDAMGPTGDGHSFRVHDYSAFVNDDYRVNQRLTFNIGLRYEYDGLLSDDHGVLTNIFTAAMGSPGSVPSASCVPQCNYAGFAEPNNYPTAGVYGVTLASLPGVTRSSNNSSILYGPPKDIFEPRFGFAYQPFALGKVVIRGGYGVFGDLPPGQSLIFGVNNSPPLANAIGKAQQANYFASLANPFLANQVGKFQDRWTNFATTQASNVGQQNFGQTWAQPILQSWNLGVQYTFIPNWVLEVAYQGSHGTHLITGGVVDLGSLALLATTAAPINGITTNTVANGVLRLPYLGFNSLRSQCTCFDSSFNSLQATVRHTFAHGFQIQGAYTYARSLTDVLGASGQSWTTNLKGNDWGPDPGYHPHRLVMNYLWNLPGSSLKGVAGKLVGGWSVSGVTTIQNGTPLSITDTRAGTIFGNFTTNGALGRAQIAPGKTYQNIATPGDIGSRLGGSAGGCGYFTSYAASGSLNGASCASLSPFMALPNAIAPDGTVTNGTGWGNTGIGIILGPGQFNFDAALVKNTRVGGIRENGNVQFRLEFFNMMNHPQFGNPSVGLASAGTFGQITSTTVNPRLIQLALKYNF